MSNEDTNTDRRRFLQTLAAGAATLSSGALLQAQEEEKEKVPPYQWRYVKEDGRPALMIKNPDTDKDEIKLIIQGKYALVRSKNADPDNFFKDFIDTKDEPKVEELTYNTVVAYPGTDPKNPLKVIFHSGAEKLRKKPGDKPGEYKTQLIDHSGAHVQFIGVGSEPAPVEFDMTRNHGSWHDNWVPTTVEFSNNLAPTLLLSPYMARCHHCEDKGNYFGYSQLEMVPKDSTGMTGSVLFCIGGKRTHPVDLVTRSSISGEVLAKKTILPAHNSKAEMLQPLKDLEAETFRTMKDNERLRLEEHFPSIDRDIEGRAPSHDGNPSLTIALPEDSKHESRVSETRRVGSWAKNT